METGLGGRLDATNVAQPVVGVITNISLEHTEYLGPTLAHVAREKAGIIKSGMAVVTGEKRKNIQEIFKTACKRNRADLFILGRDFKVRRTREKHFNYTGPRIGLKNLETNLPGPHQATNSALAITVVNLLAHHGLPVTESDMRRGLKSVNWPGRAEMIPGGPGQPDLMLDGAHNPGAARVLAKALASRTCRRLHMVLGVMADKDINGVMKPLLPLADRLYLTRPEYERAADPDVLAGFTKGYQGPVQVVPKLPEAIEKAKADAGPGDLVVVTGSLFTVGEARAYLLGGQD
jgi:dihydrofolate synthase/folylpolyglutamate synthase